MSVRVLRAGAFALGCIVLFACGPADVGAKRLGKIDEGTSRDSALTALGTGPVTATGNDTVRVVNGFPRQMFSSNGKTYEVIYYREAPGTVNDEILPTQETPLVLADGKVVGHGWKFYRKLAAKENLPVPLAARDK